MSLNDYPNAITKTESNIPVLKSSGKTKMQNRSQFPELQKYIETIINASNENDSEDASDVEEKPSKIGKLGKNAFQCENKKLKKRNFKLNLKSEKVNERTKTTVSVSSRENISNQFFSDFEDPRNWDIVTVQSDSHKNIKIEKALKNLFPNPYKLLQIPEFSKPKISMYIEKIENDDVTLPDVIISEFDAQKTLDSTHVKSIFEDGYVKISSPMDLWTLNSSSSASNRCSKTRNICKTSSFSEGVALNPTENISKNQASHKSNISSKQSSFENINECNSVQKEKKEIPYRQKKTINRKTSGDCLIDYDIGKLKLLTVTDSDDSSKDFTREKGREEFKKIVETNKSSKKDKFYPSLNDAKTARNAREILNFKHKANQTEVRNRSKSDEGERKTITKNKSKRKMSVKNSTEMNNCKKIVDSSLGNYEEPKVKISRPKVVDVKEEEFCLEKEETVKTNEKIDEVLKFMCDCLMKLRTENQPINESSMNKASAIEDEKWPELTKPPARILTNPRQDSSTAKRSETPEIFLHMPKTKKLSTSTTSRSDSRFHLVQFERGVVNNSNLYDTIYPDSPAINNENVVHTVEIQNELGGCAEEQHHPQVTTKDFRSTKSILPLSVRMKKSKTDTYKVLKNALEKEEKLVTGEFNINKLSSRQTFFQRSINMPGEDSYASNSMVGTFKRQQSNFVICVNSLPRNMRTGNLTNFYACPWTISVNEISRPVFKPLSYYQALHTEKVVFEGLQLATQKAIKTESLLVMYQSIASHVATSIGVSFATTLSKVNDENLLKNSENRIISKCKPTKKSFYVKPSIPPQTIVCKIEACRKIYLDLPSTLNNQVEELEEEVEHTEKLHYSKQNCGTTYTLSETSSTSKSGIVKDFESNEESERKKLYDLLTRTYNLQQKLHRHLERLTNKPTSVSCPSIQERNYYYKGACRNSEVLFKDSNETSEDAMFDWYLQTQLKSNVLNEASLIEVQKADRETSYDPPSGEEFKNVVENGNNVDDDRSSVYSFKSSNDFSEGEKELIDSHSEKNSNDTQFLKKVFNEIDHLKNKILPENNIEREVQMMKNEPKIHTEKIQTERCNGAKTPTKLLTTVFKGKESLTELSLGLKAVPLAKVSNISVEKKKISKNHTKISISISKEKANEFLQDQTNSKEMMRNRLSYYLDNIRPSLSICQSEDSKGEKLIQAEESEEDEDDFKSVMSTLSRPHSELNLFNEKKEIKKLEMTSTKSYNKHRFDFYHKMDNSKKIRHKSMSNTSCKFKEFEPLKQALTEMQIRMRSIKRDAYFSSNDYYQKALKLAKMSAGYCQSCGSKTVIPEDTFGYYKTILPRNHMHRHRGYYLKTTPQRSSYYSLRSSLAELSDQFCDLDLNKSSSYLLSSSQTMVRNSLNDIPRFSGKI